MAHIVCWKNGEVTVSRRVPKGAMRVLTGHGKRLRRVLALHADFAQDGRTLLVPGLQEARTDLAAIEAVRAFVDILRQTLALGPHRRVPGGGRLI